MEGAEYNVQAPAPTQSSTTRTKADHPIWAVSGKTPAQHVKPGKCKDKIARI